MSGLGGPPNARKRKQHIYRYRAPWPVFSMNWSNRPGTGFRLALGSFIEEYNNKVEVIQLDEESGQFRVRSMLDHPYPTTKIMWIPDQRGTLPDLVATSGDYLRLWRVPENQGNAELECLLNNNKSTDYCAPLTSFDWNSVDPNLMGTSSIDTTCTIWSLETGQPISRIAPSVTGHVKTQVIAHDREVYDIGFSKGADARNTFASVGAEGSLRLFDLRNLDHSSIIYEDPSSSPLLRLAWNKQDPNFVAVLGEGKPGEIVILDVRSPRRPLTTIANSTNAPVNGLAWAPHSTSHLCSAGDDRQAVIWDIQGVPKPVDRPILAYSVPKAEINQIQWSSAHPDWIAICYSTNLEILHV